jgi:hypothetical protein
MHLRRATILALSLCLTAPQAFGQGMDDLLAPLTPEATKGKKGKGREKSVKPPAGPKTKGGKASRQSSGRKGADLLAPLVQKTELLVRLGGGLKGARLFINERELGQLPRGAVELTPGEHLVTVRRPGYRDFSRSLVVPEGELTEVSVLMEAVAGFVSVRADIPGALVFVDGEEKGPAPLDGLMLSPGSHEILVRREGYRPETQTLNVRAGKEYSADFLLRPAPEAVASSDHPRAPVLTPKPAESAPPLLAEPPAVASASTPLVKRWYFWAGVGAVATAAVIGSVAASQSASGPLTPEQVCGGPCDAVINGPARAGVVRF